jgi:uncharacterized protein YyaL (SSP411 family)
LLGRWRDTGAPWQRDIVEKTLVGMATGGIRDHLGGGFHRYAVDERWIVPHFEKMSYDNSELLRAYLSAFQAFGTPLFKETATGIVNWVMAVLSDPAAGTFFTSQDADVQFGDDGGYWTWTPDEARAVLDAAEFVVVERVFDVRLPGEMPHDHEKNVLWLREEPANDAERVLFRSAVRKLKAARDLRPEPFVDRTPYVNWNAMMAGAFLQAGAVLDRPECNTLALRVLERIWQEAWSAERGMTHALGRLEPHGLLDDHVQAAAAFLDAYEAEGETQWLERAIAVMRRSVSQHWDEDAGGFFDIARDRAGTAYLTTRAKPVQDSPTPSANGVAALVLARLWAITDQKEWRDLLDRQLAAFAGSAPELSLYGATLLTAIDWAVHPVNRIAVAGPAGDGPACAMHLQALQTYRPRRVVIRTIAPQPTATVCIGTTCSLPVSEPRALAELLR